MGVAPRYPGLSAPQQRGGSPGTGAAPAGDAED